jgi:hypothetical protein
MKALGHTVNVSSLQTTDPDSGKQLDTKISKTLQTQGKKPTNIKTLLMDPDNSVLSRPDKK